MSVLLALLLIVTSGLALWLTLWVSFNKLAKLDEAHPERNYVHPWTWYAAHLGPIILVGSIASALLLYLAEEVMA